MNRIILAIFLYSAFIPRVKSQNLIDTLIRSERWMIENDLCSAKTGDTISLLSTHNYRGGNLNLSFKSKNKFEAIFKHGSYKTCDNSSNTSFSNHPVTYSQTNKIMNINLSNRMIQLKLIDTSKPGILQFVILQIK